jgi:excisionase family DNA binding protein
MSSARPLRLADLPEVVTVAEAAQVARCSKASIYRMAEAGQLRAARTSTGGSKTRVMIARQELERWLGLGPVA